MSLRPGLLVRLPVRSSEREVKTEKFKPSLSLHADRLDEIAPETHPEKVAISVGASGGKGVVGVGGGAILQNKLLITHAGCC